MKINKATAKNNTKGQVGSFAVSVAENNDLTSDELAVILHEIANALSI